MLEFSSGAVPTDAALTGSSVCPAAPAPNPHTRSHPLDGSLSFEIVGSGGLEHQGQAGGKGDLCPGRVWEDVGSATGAAALQRCCWKAGCLGVQPWEMVDGRKPARCTGSYSGRAGGVVQG